MSEFHIKLKMIDLKNEVTELRNELAELKSEYSDLISALYYQIDEGYLEKYDRLNKKGL